MSKELHQFTQAVLEFPPPQRFEELASEIHETNRLPDPYLFVFDEQTNQFITPAGESVVDNIVTDSYLGAVEYSAWQRIQDWSSNNASGLALWFSPPFEREGYENSKFIIHELSLLETGEKIIFNRAVILDIEAQELLDLANALSSKKIMNPEMLRSQPLFPNLQDFQHWFANELSGITYQTGIIESGRDLLLKREAYASAQDIYSSIAIVGEDLFSSQMYAAAVREAEDRELIGEHSRSCPPGQSKQSTAFEKALEYSSNSNEKRLNCTCPFCKKKVTATILNNKIHCPECKKSVPYEC